MYQYSVMLKFSHFFSKKIMDNWKKGKCFHRFGRMESLPDDHLPEYPYLAMNEKYVITLSRFGSITFWNRLTLQCEKLVTLIVKVKLKQS